LRNWPFLFRNPVVYNCCCFPLETLLHLDFYSPPKKGINDQGWRCGQLCYLCLGYRKSQCSYRLSQGNHLSLILRHYVEISLFFLLVISFHYFLPAVSPKNLTSKKPSNVFWDSASSLRNKRQIANTIVAQSGSIALHCYRWYYAAIVSKIIKPANTTMTNWNIHSKQLLQKWNLYSDICFCKNNPFKFLWS
jgi:hypothetical protein